MFRMARIPTTRIKEGTSLASAANGWRAGRRMKRSKIAVVPYTLSGIAIFVGLTPEALEAVHRRCSWRRYEAGDPIVDYLDSSDDVFFVTAGEASVTIYSVAGQAVSFRSLGPGEIFGEYAAIDGEPRSASVEARTNCLIASTPGREFRELLETEPVVARAVMKGLVRNVRSLTKRVYEFSTLAVNNRIQAELLRLASLAPQEGKGARLEPAPTHAEIASRVSTHREAVTRELNRLARIGIIERQHGTLIIWDLDRLATMLHEMTGE
jgi:CRP/FNR family transcriptional regulator, cyclic AMP receptor protein